MAGLTLRRLAAGLVTLLAVSVIVFFATSVLPGNAAYAILGRSATPASVHTLEHTLHLNQGVLASYWSWLNSFVSGNPGHSLVNGQPVASFVSQRFVNSAVLVLLAGFIGTGIGVALGVFAAVRRDGFFDHASAIAALAITALPEFVVAVLLTFLLATNLSHLLPGISVLPPGTKPWDQPRLLVLPVLTLVIVVVPYLFRMTRAGMIEALESDYVMMARLKGLSQRRVIFLHALPNVLAPSIQVIGLIFLYLAGGIVVVETVFNYPGVGQGLVSAVSDRDVPVIQFLVIALAAFYVLVNISTDLLVLAVTPRRRLPR